MRLLTSPARRSVAIGVALASAAVVLQFGVGLLGAFLGALPVLQGIVGEATFVVFISLVLAAVAVVVRGAASRTPSAREGAALLPSSFGWISTVTRWSSVGLGAWLARSVAKNVLEAGLYTGHRHLSAWAAVRRLVSHVLSADGGVPLVAAILFLVAVDASARAVLRGGTRDLARARLLARGTLFAGLATLAAMFVPLFRVTPIDSIDALGGYVAYYTPLSPGVWETTAVVHLASLVLITVSLMVLAAARIVEFRRARRSQTVDGAAPAVAKAPATAGVVNVRVDVACRVDVDSALADDLHDEAVEADADERPRARRRLP